jgi:hypothetical protein
MAFRFALGIIATATMQYTQWAFGHGAANLT